MKRLGFLLVPTLLMLGMIGIIFWSSSSGAASGPNLQVNTDYASSPPFLTNVVTPNVLILLDESGSMGRRVQCELQTGSDFSTCPTFDETFVYGGLFDSLTCYIYNTTDTRFDADTTVGVSPDFHRANVSTLCPAADWDGNFLSWVTLRRIDMAKIALIGGSCAVARATDGTCPLRGITQMITLKGATEVHPSGSIIATPAVPTGSGPNHANGRVPSNVQLGGQATAPANLFIHLPGETGSLVGSFCVDDDTTAPSVNPSTCSDGDAFTEQQFVIHVSVANQRQGVIQSTGPNVRFGLMEFLGNVNLGGKVLVPIGSPQAVQLNVSPPTPTTYASNTVAMV